MCDIVLRFAYGSTENIPGYVADNPTWSRHSALAVVSGNQRNNSQKVSTHSHDSFQFNSTKAFNLWNSNADRLQQHLYNTYSLNRTERNSEYERIGFVDSAGAPERNANAHVHQDVYINFTGNVDSDIERRLALS